MREHGLAVEGGPEPIHLPKVNVTDDPATIGPVDMVMFCVKLWDTEAAARQLIPIMEPETGVISFQNGVHQGRHAAADLRRPGAAGRRRLCGHQHRPARRDRCRPGPLQRLVFGEYDGRRSARAETFLAACKRGGINAELSDDVRRSLWEKFVVLVAMSGATTTMRQTIGPIRSNPLTRAFLLDLAREVVAVGRAHGVNLPPDYAEQRIPFFDELAAGDDDVDAPRPQRRQAAGGALARRRRGRSRRPGGRADADEPAVRDILCCTPRAGPPAPRIEQGRNGGRAALTVRAHPRGRRRGADDLRARHQPRRASPRRRCC